MGVRPMAEDSYIIHIVHNPRSFEVTRTRITSHYQSATGPVKEGWHFYYEREDGAVSHLFGPFRSELSAKGCANSDTYRVNKEHRWRKPNGELTR